MAAEGILRSIRGRVVLSRSTVSLRRGRCVGPRPRALSATLSRVRTTERYRFAFARKAGSLRNRSFPRLRSLYRRLYDTYEFLHSCSRDPGTFYPPSIELLLDSSVTLLFFLFPRTRSTIRLGSSASRVLRKRSTRRIVCRAKPKTSPELREKFTRKWDNRAAIAVIVVTIVVVTPGCTLLLRLNTVTRYCCRYCNY